MPIVDEAADVVAFIKFVELRTSPTLTINELWSLLGEFLATRGERDG